MTYRDDVATFNRSLTALAERLERVEVKIETLSGDQSAKAVSIQSLDDKLGASFSAHSNEIKHNSGEIKANTVQIKQNTDELRRIEQDVEALRETVDGLVQEVRQARIASPSKRASYWAGVWGSLTASVLLIVIVVLAFAFGDRVLPPWFLDWIRVQFSMG